MAFLFYDFFLLSSVSNESGAKNPEKLFENWKLGFPIGAVPTMDHSKLDLIGVLNSFNRYSSIKKIVGSEFCCYSALIRVVCRPH